MLGSFLPSNYATLAQRLSATRRRYFVGRSGERELFRSTLESEELPFIVMHIYGPGGVGKTTLLGEFADVCFELGATPLLIDARNLEPSPMGFLNALRLTMGLTPDASPLEALALRPNRSVLMLDTYELMTPLDSWLREHFLPHLPLTTLVVLAGRQPPSPAWRSDPGWHGLTCVVSLRNLRPDESSDFLKRRGIPEIGQEGILAFTHGHPLALSLVADVLDQSDKAVSFTPEQSPDVVATLLERFIHQVPSPAHREALEICAHARVTNEELLREALSEGDPHELFDWLRSLSFIEQGPQGLFPHDLAREVIDTDLRWRDPDTYTVRHARVRTSIVRRMQVLQGSEQWRAVHDLFFLHRNSPIMKPIFYFQEIGTVYTETAQPADHPAILAMTERFEGAASASLAAYWLERQPEAFVVARGANKEALGYLAHLALHKMAPQAIETDPITKLAWSYAEKHAPLRSGEAMLHGRFMIDWEGYQQPSPVFNALQMALNLHWLTTPKLGWAFLTIAEPERWRLIMSYIDFHLISETISVNGNTCGIYAHDWRAVDALAWFELMGRREIATDLTLGKLAGQFQAPQLLVLSQPEFVNAIKGALQAYHNVRNLAGNPLLRARFVIEASGGQSGEVTLQTFLREAIDKLKSRPKDEKFYRALFATYVEPAMTQELAAERLGLPFGTYRYQLNTGINRVAAYLWELELNGFMT